MDNMTEEEQRAWFDIHEAPRADGLTVNDGPTPPFEPSQMTPLAEGAPQYIQGVVSNPDTAAQPDTDCHGMVHDDTIHSTTEPQPKPEKYHADHL